MSEVNGCLLVELNPLEVRGLLELNGYYFIDVRTPEEYKEGYVVGSLNIPLYENIDGEHILNSSFTGKVKCLFQDSSPIVIGSLSGARSLEAYKILNDVGYDNLVNMKGGYFGAKCNSTGKLIEKGWVHYFMN